MSQIISILLFSWLAGLTAFIGGLIARYEQTVESRHKDEWIHGVMAFGGGILVAAVAFSLAPEGIKTLSTTALGITFLAGGVIFSAVDAYLSNKGGNKAQFMAMLMDFIPEALALGALFATNENAAILLALFIAAQNLPEGFNSFREILSDQIEPKTILSLLFGISLLGPVAATIGFYFLQDQHVLTASIMSFAAGGILYLVFKDIAPKATMQRHWAPSLGAVLGFLLGMIGQQMLG
ncbi:ZIP family metal transporter [Gracilimonas mengyeensis]|uniref:Zinc transporter, ZIP family n=1 Tax=Gracilimonas mengyeensis TaxID=1302730 RepID=A0A521E9D1_9BACT|nr:ZIP family metal transporter [Gracilimonas mengyeensis]SMO80523.1 zinc transporter, ZIP family [Gracilimonas mengyeensis]